MGLTKREIDAASIAPGQARLMLWDDDPRGLGLRVYESGRKTFVVTYRDAGGAKRLATIGDYGVFTLDQARDAAREMLRIAESGADALKVRRARKAAPTFRDLIDAYKQRHVPTKKSGAEDVRKITKYLGAWESRKLDSISREDVRVLVSQVMTSPRERGAKGATKAGRPKAALPDGPKPYEANRLLALLSKMFALAELWELVPAGHPNPCKGVPKAKEQKRDRWVEPTELPALAKAIDAEADPYAHAALWLYLLTGCRKSELLSAKWADVNTARAVLRLSDTKAGRPHEVPLVPAALAIFEALPREEGNPFVFPGRRDGNATDQDPRHMESIRGPWDRARTAAGVADVRLHDLRRTVGSWLATAGNSLHLIGKILNHSNVSTTQVYARLGKDTARTAMEAYVTDLLGVAGKLPKAPRATKDEPAQDQSAQPKATKTSAMDKARARWIKGAK